VSPPSSERTSSVVSNCLHPQLTKLVLSLGGAKPFQGPCAQLFMSSNQGFACLPLLHANVTSVPQLVEMHCEHAFASASRFALRSLRIEQSSMLPPEEVLAAPGV